MKLFAIALAFVLAGVVSAAAAEVKCSSADGDFQFSSWTFQGGMKPPDPATRETWTYKGQAVTAGEFSGKTVIKNETVGHTRKEVYVATLKFVTDSGPVQDFVICRSQKYAGPPLP